MLKTPDPITGMDECHAKLLGALAGVYKPKRILELGLGTGIVTDAILAAFDEYAVYAVVDNWMDWGSLQDSKPPQEVFGQYGDYGIEFITMDEKDFIDYSLDQCHTYDFIVSDADHHHAHEWFDKVYSSILTPGGILAYHDVGDGKDFIPYGGLRSILDRCKERGYNHMHFYRNSHEGERCERGLLVIFKP